MKSILKNKLNGKEVTCTSTTDTPESSYGQAVWVDADGNAYGVVGYDNPMYDELLVDVNDRDALGQYLRLRRVSLGISIRKMATLAELTPSTVQNVENGAFTPRLDVIVKMLSVLGKRLTIS